MSLEVAVRNPERYSEILRVFSQFKGLTLDDDGILEVFAQLYIDGVVSTKKLDATASAASEVKDFIKNNIRHNNEWGYPTGYQAGFTRYLKTLSEFGFIYSQYNEPLRLSEVAEAVVSGKLSLSEAFALQSLRFWRKSPYRRVLNDFNFFKFIIEVIRRRNEDGQRLSYPQFMLALFSDDGDVNSFIRLIEENPIGDIEVFAQGFYWLIEATLIRNKNQQINNETINLFRHIDSTYSSTKYMSLIAPCIHDDTKLLIRVATIVSMLEQKSLIFAKPYSTAEYISNMSNRQCISDMQENTMGFVSDLGNMLSDMGKTFKRIE